MSGKKRLTIEEFIKRLPSHISLYEDTYINTHSVAKFRDSLFGDFTAYANNVIHGNANHKKRVLLNRRNTCIAKYGVESTNQVKSVQDKQINSHNKRKLYKHWKTNESLIAMGNFECIVIEKLNENKIDYEWQNKIFTMPNGKTYRPDVFLIKQNLWIEIKGYFRNDAKQKWEWFHKEYPNSQLWQDKYIGNFLKKMENYVKTFIFE